MFQIFKTALNVMSFAQDVPGRALQGRRPLLPERHHQRRRLVPADRRDAGLPLHLARLHGGDAGAELLQVPSGVRAAAVLEGQPGLAPPVHRGGAQGSQGIRQGRGWHAHRGGVNEGEEA